MLTEIPINRYSVEMVKPSRCIQGYGHDILRKHTEASYSCDACIFNCGSHCRYNTIDVAYASGHYESEFNGNTIDFEQFCCPSCGELISQHSTRHIEWKRIRCGNCGFECVCIKDDYKNEILTLAVAVA